MAEARAKDSGRLATELQGRMHKEDQFAYLQTLADRNSLHMVDNISGKNLGEFMDENEKLIKQYGQGKLSGDADTAMLSNKTMREAQRRIDNKRGNEPMEVEEMQADGKMGKTSYASAIEALKTSTDKFIKGLDSSKISQMNMKMAFGKPSEPASEMTKTVLENLAENQPRLVPNMISKMKGSELDDFTKKYSDTLNAKIATLGKDDEKSIKLTNALNALRNSIANQTIFGAQQQTTATPPPPPPKT
jgi:hypothetical protein